MHAMNRPDNEDEAAAFAMGLLDGEAHAAAARRAGADPAFEAQVEAWEARLAPLISGLAPIDPGPDALFLAERRLDALSVPGFVGTTLRADEGAWHPWVPGIAAKLLNRRPEANREMVLVRVDPGTPFPTHPHHEDEELFMISGDLWFGDIELKAGDFHLARAGTVHPPAFSRHGCLCIIIKEID
jgi:quercetin dioxygenase-like cupin family protein